MPQAKESSRGAQESSEEDRTTAPSLCVLTMHCLQVPSQPPLSPDIPILRYGILENRQETLPRATSTTCSMNSKTLMTWGRVEHQSARAAL